MINHSIYFVNYFKHEPNGFKSKMGSCSTSSKPIKCKVIKRSKISNNVKLTSTIHLGIHEEYEFIRILGHGQYGTVREAHRKSQSNSKFAIKSITKQNISKHRKVLKRELEIMQIVDHPNIIHLYETYEDELYLHLVLELCTGGDVCERIITKGSFCESQAAGLMKILLGAVNYLHLNNIIHRDLKPENFLYVDNETEYVKICDFGMSVRNNRNNRMKSIAGTPYYLAPEVLKGNYTKACDVWSLGVFMYFILIGKHPFRGKSLESIYEKAAKGINGIDLARVENISDLAKDLMEKMLTVQVNRRINLVEALSHPWLNSGLTESNFKIPDIVFKNLSKYKAKSKLWQEAIKIVVKNLSNSQIKTLREAFITMDTTNSGFITAADLEKSMKTHGFNLALEEIENIIQNCSYIHAGKINYSDFLVASLNKKALRNGELIWEAFNIFDKKGMGKINLKDLDGALKQAGCEFSEEEFKDLISEAKIDENSDINFENFKVIMACFEEEEESLCVRARRMSLVKKMTKDFKNTIEKARTLGNGRNLSKSHNFDI